MPKDDDGSLNRIDSIWPLLARPLWVVSAASKDRRGGLIATWITQSSLNPQTPQVMAGLAPNHFTAGLIDQSGAFALHLLRTDQLDLVERFAAKSGRDGDKLTGLTLRNDPDHPIHPKAPVPPREESQSTPPSASGERPQPPILADCLAWMDCRVFARLDVGDRIFFWADIVAGDLVDGQVDPAGAEVLRESHLGRLSPEVRSRLRDDRESDITKQTPWAQEWRDSLPVHLQPKTPR